jgi:hypothetical protein
MTTTIVVEFHLGSLIVGCSTLRRVVVPKEGIGKLISMVEAAVLESGFALATILASATSTVKSESIRGDNAGNALSETAVRNKWSAPHAGKVGTIAASKNRFTKIKISVLSTRHATMDIFVIKLNMRD